MIDLGHRDMRALADAWLPGMVSADRAHDKPLIKTLTDMVLRADGDLHERHIRALINRRNATQYLNAINCPALLLTGSDDVWSPVSQHQEIQQLVSNATLEIIQGAGHFAPVEYPDAVASCVLQWIRATNPDIS